MSSIFDNDPSIGAELKLTTDARASSYRQMDDIEHARKKTSMYWGNLLPQSSNEYMPMSDGTFRKVPTRISQAAYKCIDELTQNAIDQVIVSNGRAQIWFDIDIKLESFSIKNDKTCIPVCVKKDIITGESMYNPQMLFSKFRSGSHYDEKIEGKGEIDHQTGGTYGYGVKLVNAFCKWLTLETVDLTAKVHYFQKFEKCLQIIGKPIMRRPLAGATQFTRIECALNWADFGMDGSDSKNLKSTFYDVLYMRAILTATYIAPQKVYWRGEPIAGCMPRQFASAFITPYVGVGIDGKPNPPIIHNTDIKGPEFLIDGKMQTLPWTVVVGIRSSDEFEHVCLVNGIHARGGGTIVQRIEQQLLEYMKKPYMAMVHKNDRNAKFTNRNVLMKYIFLYLRCSINTPSFKGNRKDEVDNDIKNFAGYELPTEFMNRVWEDIKPYIKMDLLSKSRKDAVKKIRTRAKKYVAAKYAGNRGNACSLFIAEGDSAVGVINTLISHSPSLNFENYGVFSIQGVPINVRKETKREVCPTTGRRVAIRSSMLLKNERISALISVLGLTRDVKYLTPEDIAKLPYARGVIIATDQDIDGTGNIRSLILNIFQTEWPELLAAGYIRFLITPIVRTYHKEGKLPIQEFLTEHDYRIWRDSGKINVKDWETRYYKGLAGHSIDEIKQIAKTFHKMLIVVYSDADAEMLFERYFGVSTEARKIALRKAAIGQEHEYYDEGSIDVSNHLETQTHLYQLANVERHLPSVMDGLTSTSRKIACGARAKFAKNNRQCHVYQLTGYIAEKMSYHQGDSSASSVTIHMAQSFSGAKEFPILRAISQFGCRKMGGKDAGAPRYISLKYNNQLSDALYPRVDDCNLKYNLEDGKRREPAYYVPIIPTSILEHARNPASGWAIKLWGRNWEEVFDHVIQSVSAGELIELKRDYSPSLCGLNFDIVTTSKGVQVAIGKWKRISSDVVQITDLPIGMWNDTLINGSDKKKATTKKESKEEKKSVRLPPWADNPEIENVFDTSDQNLKTDIRITFKSGVLESILSRERKDGICPLINYLGLKQSLKPNLNMIGPDGTVLEFGGDYRRAVSVWWPIRRDLYGQRITRQIILLELRIIVYSQKILYANHRDDLKLSRKRKVVQETILQEHKYIRLDNNLLERPNFVETKDLKRVITEGPGISYDYLLRMSDLHRGDEEIDKLEKKIEDANNEIASLCAKDIFPGRRQWLKELTELRAIIDKGKREGWDAWDKKHKFAT